MTQRKGECNEDGADEDGFRSETKHLQLEDGSSNQYCTQLNFWQFSSTSSLVNN